MLLPTCINTIRKIKQNRVFRNITYLSGDINTNKNIHQNMLNTMNYNSIKTKKFIIPVQEIDDFPDHPPGISQSPPPGSAVSGDA